MKSGTERRADELDRVMEHFASDEGRFSDVEKAIRSGQCTIRTVRSSLWENSDLRIPLAMD